MTDVTAAEEARRAEAARVAAAEAEAARLAGVVGDLRETTRALQHANEGLAAANTLLRRANEESGHEKSTP